MNILRPASPTDDERLYPAAYFLIELAQVFAYSIRLGVVQILRVPFNIQISFSHKLVTNILEIMSMTQILVYDLDALPKLTFTQGLPYRILDGDSGIILGGDVTVVESYIDPGGYVSQGGIYDSDDNVLVSPGAVVPQNFIVPAGARVTGGYYFSESHGIE